MASPRIGLGLPPRQRGVLPLDYEADILQPNYLYLSLFNVQFVYSKQQVFNKALICKKMKKIEIVWFSIFGFLSIITLLENIVNYKGLNNMLFVFSAAVSNFFLAVLIISLNNLIFKKTGEKYYLIILNSVCFVIIIFYLISTFIRFLFGSFASLSGIGFFWMSNSSPSLFLAALLIILISTILSVFTTKKVRADKAFSLKKMIIVVLFFVFIAFTIPNFYLQNATPFTDVLAMNIQKVDLMPTPQTDNSSELIFENLKYKQKGPNIVVIMLESLSPEHIHYYGYERNITPNLDWFFENGIAFENAYSSATHTEYAQTAFLSSRYPLKSKIRDTFNEEYPREFIWDILKKYNYTTGYITSQDDRWLNLENYWKKDNLDLYWTGLNDNESKNTYFGFMSDDKKALQIADSFINSSTKPFFLYVNFQSTHYPYDYPKEYSIFKPDKLSLRTFYTFVAKNDNQTIINRYDNSIYYADEQIGKLKKILEDKDILNNTIVVIIADHGEMINEQHGYRFHGSSIYEGNIKIPLAIFLPGQKSQLIKERVKSIDVVPTLLDTLSLNSSNLFQGEIMKKDSEIFIMAQTQNFMIGIIKNNIKYIVNLNTGEPDEAYNLSEDPKELQNLLKKKSSAGISKYREKLMSWYNCQINYYQNETYKLNSSISC